MCGDGGHSKGLNLKIVRGSLGKKPDVAFQSSSNIYSGVSSIDNVFKEVRSSINLNSTL